VTSRIASVAPWLLATLAIALTLLNIPLEITIQRQLPDATRAPLAVAGLVAIVFSAVAVMGGLLGSRVPRNPVGWLLLAIAIGLPLGTVGNSYATLAAHGHDLPAAAYVGVLGRFGSNPVLFGAIFLLFLLFPDGRLPARDARAAASAVGLLVATLSALSFEPRGFGADQALANPIAIDGAEPVFAFVGALRAVLLPIAALATLLTMVRRFRRSRGVERKQLAWFFYAAGLLAIGIVLFAITLVADVGALVYVLYLLLVLGLGFLPIATGIAILRYHLYDIDLLINRTLVYGLTTAAIAITFFGGIVVLQTPLRTLTGGSELAVAVSTLASFALFQPLRARVQAGVDQRFYRSRYDATLTVDEFSVRLRDEVDLDAVRSDLLGAVTDTMRPAHASVWLREARR
jgi:hypothetical protein